MLDEKKKTYFLLLLPIMFIIAAFIFDDIGSIINGLFNIITNPDILLTDYLEVGGLGATFLNSAILMLVNILLIRKLGMRINGVSTAAIFILAGFAFLGKNIYNVWPIYLGGLLYAKYQNTTFKSVALITMFGTALSPLVNEITYGLNLPFPINIIVGILGGILAGFVLPPLSSHLIRVHDGYSIYNIGFTAGFVGTVVTSLLRGFGLTIEATSILSSQYDLILKVLLFTFFVILIIIGYVLNGKSFKNYTDLFEYSGRLITDFTQLTNFGITAINMGVMGIIGILYVIISQGVINGPVVGGLLTLVGFSAFGKHPRNSVPILLGVLIAGLVNVWDVSSTSVIIGALFGTTLAPIAGEYGWLSGICAGFIHLSIVMNVGVLHGGLNLYNNGFAGGLVASILVPIIDGLKRED